MTTWILYAVLVSTLVGLGAWVLERGASGLGLPLRWIWLGAFGAALGIILAPTADVQVSWLAPSVTVGELVPGLLPAAVEGPLLEREPRKDAGGAGILAFVDHLLPWLWGLWTAVLGLRWFIAARRIRHRARSWASLDPPVQIGGRPVLTSPDTGPAVLGSLRGQVVLPRWCLELPRAEQELILSHEAQHVRAQDSLLLGGGYLLTVLLPWNLPFWFYLRRLRQAVEVDCDARVVGEAPDARHAYGRLLVSVCSRGHIPGPAPAMLAPGTSSLSRRILMLTDDNRGAWSFRALLLVAAGLLVLVGSCLVPGPDRDVESLVGPEIADEGAERAGDVASTVEDDRAELAREPTFTPFTVAPEVRNRQEVMSALQAAYPSELRSQGVGGTVLMHFFIDEVGALQNTVLAESSGLAALDDAAEAVARTFQFSPALNQGDPVPVWIQLPITFQPS